MLSVLLVNWIEKESLFTAERGQVHVHPACDGSCQIALRFGITDQHYFRVHSWRLKEELKLRGQWLEVDSFHLII
jgi:hypothetical protein